MLEIHTNNLVESWHNILKTVYLKGARKQRIDSLVHKLLKEVLVDLRLKFALISNGFQRRRTNLVEQKQLDECNSIPDSIANGFVERSFDNDTQESLGEDITVRSFTNDDIKYKVLLNNEGQISKCSCPYMSTNNIVCKHMNMASRILTHGICFLTRDQVDSSLNNITPEKIQESGEICNRGEFHASMEKILRLAEPYWKSSDDLGDSEK